MDKKNCRECNSMKSISDFPKYKNSDGTFGYRNICKDCRNKKRREKRKDFQSNNFVSSEMIPNENTLKIENENDRFSLNGFQKEKMFKLLDHADELINILDNRIDFNVDENKAGRVIKSINFDNKLYEIIVDESKKQNISISDFVNLLVKKGLDFL